MTDQVRRNFLKGSAATLAGITILPRSVFGANDRLNVALVGVGGMGRGAVRYCARNSGVNVIAFADVDEIRASEIYTEFPTIPRYRDFRRMLDKHKEIDAVWITTPDHTHHYIGLTCMMAGKHVYLQKPLAHNIEECRSLMVAEKKYGLVCQMGNQGHSSMNLPLLRAWYEEGFLGDVREVHAWTNSVNAIPNAELRPGQPVPSTLDWDLWLGPAQKIPYNEAYLPARWRSWFPFGNGALGDWACHNMDAPYWAFDLDCPKEVRIKSTGQNKWSFPMSAMLTFVFDHPNGNGDLIFNWYQGDEYKPERPADLESDQEMGNHYGGTLVMGSKASAIMESHSGGLRIFPETKRRELAEVLPRGQRQSNHSQNWLLACKGLEKARSDFAYGGRLSEVMHFGNIALHVDRNLKINPKTREIIGDEEATKMMSWPPPRKGWEV